MIPNVFFALPADFGNYLPFQSLGLKIVLLYIGRYLEQYDTLTKLGVDNEAKSRCRIDALIYVVYRSLWEKDLLPNTGNSRATLSFETPFKWSPVPINGVPHTCIGNADYTVLFGGKDHMACHLVVLEAKERGEMVGSGQVLAYMAMVQANRKAQGQSNWSVWGCLSDGWDFRFYFLDLDGNWSSRMLSAILGWQEIANIWAHMIIQAQAVANCPLRPSLSSTRGPSTSTRPLSIASTKGSISKRKSMSDTIEPQTKRQRTPARGYESVTSEVPTIGSWEVELDDFAKES